MAKSKRRKKVARRSKGQDRNSPKVSGTKRSQSPAGSMMSMRSGIKGLAGSLVGQESADKKTSRFVSIFWWGITVVLGVAAAVFFYQRFG